MVEFIKFAVGIAFLLILWRVLRTVAKFIESVISLKDNQNEILDLLEEIKEELKKTNKFNEDDKKSNNRL